MLHVMLLAYDRYQAIIHPLSYSNPNKIRWVTFQIVSAYIVSVAIYLPMAIQFAEHDQDNNYCYLFVPFFATMIFFTNVIPMIAMSFMYAMCAYGLHRQYHKIHPMTIRVAPADNAVDLQQQVKLSIWKRLLDILGFQECCHGRKTTNAGSGDRHCRFLHHFTVNYSTNRTPSVGNSVRSKKIS